MNEAPLTIQLADRCVEVTHLVNRRLKNVYIQIRPEGVVLKSPGISRREALELLAKQRTWLERRLRDTPVESTALPETMIFLGKEYQIQLEAASGPAQLRLDEASGICTLSLHEQLHDRPDLILQALDRFYLAQARPYFHDRMIFWSQKMGLAPSVIRFKRLKSRWGSCSSKDAINLNYRAIQLPPECIDAILVHELAHLRHLNHGARFWALVHTYIPDYKERDKVIRALSGRVL